MFSPAVKYKVLLAWCPFLCCGWPGGTEYAKNPAYSVSGCEGVHRSLWPWRDQPGGWLKSHAQQLLGLPRLCSLEHGGAHVNSGPGICLSAQCIPVGIQHTGCYKPHPSRDRNKVLCVHQLLSQCPEGAEGDLDGQWPQHPTKGL